MKIFKYRRKKINNNRNSIYVKIYVKKYMYINVYDV